MKGGYVMRPLAGKADLQRLRKTVNDSLKMPTGIKSRCLKSARARLSRMA